MSPQKEKAGPVKACNSSITRRRLRIGRVNRNLRDIGPDMAASQKTRSTPKPWEDRFDELKENIQNGVTKPSNTLSRWAKVQRWHYSKKSLSKERIEKLESIGFKWKLRELNQPKKVSEWLDHLRGFQQEFGHVNVPRQYKRECDGTVVDLGSWAAITRHKYKSGKVDDELKEILDAMGFVWKMREQNPQKKTSEWLDHLREFQLEFGHVNVPHYYKKESNGTMVNLGSWVNHTRSKFKQNELDKELKQTLDSMGFVWKMRDRNQRDVTEWLDHLRGFQQEFGHVNVPKEYKKESDGMVVNLGFWVKNTRSKYTRGELDEQLKQTLDSMGFVWKIQEHNQPKKVSEWLDHLREFQQEFGHVNVPAQYKKECNGTVVNLGFWVQNIRSKFKQNEQLDEELKQTLDSMGFVWKMRDRNQRDVTEWLDHLREFQQEFGHVNVPKSYKKESDGTMVNLGTWVNHTRAKFKQNEQLDEELKQTLDSMGFLWKMRDHKLHAQKDVTKWLDHLREFHKEFGHVNVPHSYKKESDGTMVNLGFWVGFIRSKFKQNEQLDEELKQTLDSMGFVWKMREHKLHAQKDVTKWLDHLREFHKEFGHVNVPHSYKKESDGTMVKLGFWVSSIRSKFKQNEQLDEELKQALDSMGFVWKMREVSPPKKVSEWLNHLREFQQEFGHVNVPHSYKKESDGTVVNLGSWVQIIRAKFKQNELDSELKQTLDSMGFVWSVRRDVTEWLDHLREFQQEFGHVNVPRRYKKDCDGMVVNLGSWVQNTRFRQNRLDEELKQTLDAIGFVWEFQTRTDPHDMIRHLQDYKLQFGHLRVPRVYKINKTNGTCVNLGNWVSDARKKYKRGEMDDELKKKLDAVGFAWDPTAQTGLALRKSYQPPKRNLSNQIILNSEDYEMSMGSDGGSTMAFVHTPEPKRKRFWRPPTPYPTSDDEDDSSGPSTPDHFQPFKLKESDNGASPGN